MRRCYPPIQFDLKCCHCQHSLKGMGVEERCPSCNAPVRDTWALHLQRAEQGMTDGTEYRIEQAEDGGYPDLYIPYEDGVGGYRWDRFVGVILLLLLLLLVLIILFAIDLGFNFSYVN